MTEAARLTFVPATEEALAREVRAEMRLLESLLEAASRACRASRTFSSSSVFLGAAKVWKKGERAY
jgi:hypothetical protein